MKAKAAFTLIELLVVLGVIALLLAILLPTFVSVRRSARRTACASNQRQVAAAGLARAADGGFLPLCGVIQLPAGTDAPGTLPAALNDSNRTRYAYRVDDLGDGTTLSYTGEQVPPPMISLLPYLGDAGEGEMPGQDWRRMVDLHAPMNLWVCPSEANEPIREIRPGETINWPDTMLHTIGVDGDPWDAANSAGDGFGTIWFPRTDYAYNEGVTGFHHDRRFAAVRANGQLSAVKLASQTLLLADAITYKPFGLPMVGFTPRVTEAPGRVTLADVRDKTAKISGKTPVSDRHGGRCNVAFLDGHAAAVRVDADELEAVLLLP